MGVVAHDPVDKAQLALIPATATQSGSVKKAATNADVAGAIPAGGTGAAAGGFDTAGNRDTFITTVTEIKTQLNALQAKLRTAGILTS